MISSTPRKRPMEEEASQDLAEVSASKIPVIETDSNCQKDNEQNHPENQLLQNFDDLSPVSQERFLDMLCDRCTHNQLLILRNKSKKLLKQDIISNLPPELALHILGMLRPENWTSVALVCRNWYILTQDFLLWKTKCQEEGIDESLLEEIHRNRSRDGSTADFHSQRHRSEYWQLLYKTHSRINGNWINGRCERRVLKGHDEHVITCLIFDGDKIISGSDDNTLKIWDAKEKCLVVTLYGHNGGVWCAQVSGNYLISGSTDRAIKIWDLAKCECVHTLYGHTSTVRCLSVHDKRIVSGSRDMIVRLWDLETGRAIRVYNGHAGAVRCVQFDGNYIVSGGYDAVVKVWDANSDGCLYTFDDHQDRVYSLLFDGTYAISGSLDSTIHVYNVKSGICEQVLTGHQSLTSGMQLVGKTLVSGNADTTVRIWNIETGECLHTLNQDNSHTGAVTCVHVNRKFVVTSSDDGTVKLWSLETGKFIRNLLDLKPPQAAFGTNDGVVLAPGFVNDLAGNPPGVVWRVAASHTQLVCAVGSRNGTADTSLVVLDFDPDGNEAGFGPSADAASAAVAAVLEHEDSLLDEDRPISAELDH